MIWKTSRDSTRIPTKDGSLVVRVDGDPHQAPLLLCQRFRGTMDDWDPEFVARLATTRRVIRFDNQGIGESGGETPNTVRGMAEVVPLLLDALGIDAVDLLGWSLGGYVGQTVALTWPERIRHLVIAGSGPGGPDGPPPHPRVAEIAAKTAATREDVQFLFFTETEAGIAAARRHFDRISLGERPARCGGIRSPTARGDRVVVEGGWSGTAASWQAEHAGPSGKRHCRCHGPCRAQLRNCAESAKGEADSLPGCRSCLSISVRGGLLCRSAEVYRKLGGRR
jgi:pimeloyl-ACP methyl ester carboxylesterase